MNDKATLLTAEGLEKLQKELHYLTTIKRAEVAERIYQAKEEGDLRENAEYDEAKREQGFVEGRIRELEHMLKNVKLIHSTNGGQIGIGSTVTILDMDEEETETYTIVGAAEANPQRGLISNESPWGSALLGKKEGDWVTVETPRGKISFEVIEVQCEEEEREQQRRKREQERRRREEEERQQQRLQHEQERTRRQTEQSQPWYYPYQNHKLLVPDPQKQERWFNEKYFLSIAENLTQDYAFDRHKIADYSRQSWQEIKTERRYQIPSKGRAEIEASDNLKERLDLRSVRFVQEEATAPSVFLRFSFGEPAVIGVVKVTDTGKVEGFHRSFDSQLFQALIEAIALSYYRDLVTPGKTYFYQPGNQLRSSTSQRSTTPQQPRRLPRPQSKAISTLPRYSFPEWYEAQERARHQVTGHLREMKNKTFVASEEKQQQAQKAGVDLPDGYTWVQEHERGSRDSSELKLDGVDLPKRILFSSPERASRELEQLF